MPGTFAVIKTANNPFALVKLENGNFFQIPDLPDTSALLRHSLVDIKHKFDEDLQSKKVLVGEQIAPIAADSEVWGAGVTYLRSKDARKEESGVPDVYQRVYEADRPEIFFKSIGNKVSGHLQTIGIRADAKTSVPEPEVAIVINKFREIIGLTICNDVTSRNIEGENPLYLPQAKMYFGSTALGPVIKPIWQIKNLASLSISAKIMRGANLVWQAQTSLASLNRKFDDLVDYLFRCQSFPNGVILSTGTGIVPPMDITLMANDVVTIEVEEIGTLENQVVVTAIDINEQLNNRAK